MKVGTNDLFTQPWNTVAGSNWVWDVGVIRATTQGTSNTVGGGGLMADPYTGLAYPQRIESAELTYKEGLPIRQNLDWVKVTTATADRRPARYLGGLGRDEPEVDHRRREIPRWHDGQCQERSDLSGRSVRYGQMA